MRIPSGSTDRKIGFVAVDSTDLKTRETGLTTFTVYRSRNGGVATAMTTPTVAELDATNMPGVYTLLLDEDTTLTAGNDSEEMILHISQASMAPVTRTVEIYRPETTEGNTLDVTSTGAAGVDWGNVENQSTSVTLSGTTVGTTTTNTDMVGTDNALLAASAPTNFGDLAITLTTGKVTVGTNDDKTGYALSAAGVDAIWDEAQSGHTTAGTFGYYLDQQVSLAIAPTAASVADAVWDETLSDHLTAGSTGNALNAAGSAGDPWATAIPGAYGAGTAGKILGDNIDAAISSRSSHAAADVWDVTTSGHVTAGTFGEQCKTDIDAILVDTSTTLDTHMVDIKGTGFVKDTHSLVNIEGYVDLIDDGTSGLAKIATDVAAVLVDTGTDGVVVAAASKTGYALSATGADLVLVDGKTLPASIQIIAAACAGKVSGAGSGTEVFKGLDGATTRATVTVDASGNRTAVTY